MVETQNAQRETTVLANISRYFDHHGTPWKKPYREERERWHDYNPIKLRETYALDFIKDGPKERVVDLGCGIGHALVQMKRLGFKHVIGIDISPEMLAEARKTLVRSDLGDAIELHSCDVQNLSMIKPRSVDACTALGVIEYLTDDAPLLREANRILKPGGVAVMQTRNFYCMNTRTFRLVQRVLPMYRPLIRFREHRPPAFRASAERCGFRVEQECFSHFHALYPLTALPILRKLVRPINNVLSNACEGLRFSRFSMVFGATYMAKLRKVIDVQA